MFFSLEKEEVTKMQYNLKGLNLAAHWFLNVQQLKFSVPKNLFQTFTYKTISTLLFTIMSFALIYNILFLIDNHIYFYINDKHIISSHFITFLYYSFVTITTAGYGDIFPIHIISKLFTIVPPPSRS